LVVSIVSFIAFGIFGPHSDVPVKSTEVLRRVQRNRRNVLSDIVKSEISEEHRREDGEQECEQEKHVPSP
jgi:hypothetical protein